MLSVHLCILWAFPPKSLMSGHFLHDLWFPLAIVFHYVASCRQLLEEAQIFFQYLIPFVAMRPKSAKDPWTVFVVMCAPSLSVIRKTESTSAGAYGHWVPGVTYTASPDINQLSWIVLSLDPQTGYMTFPEVIQSVKNILPKIRRLDTERSALKQFNKL